MDRYYNPHIPPNVPQARVYDFNIYDYGGKDPFETIHDMFSSGVPEVFWTRHNGGHWLIFGAKAISEAVVDTKRFSSSRPIVPDDQNFDEPFFLPLWSDPPAHAGLRKVIAPLLLPARISKLEERMRRFTESIAARIKERGECEFMREFATEMPVVVFLQFLDLPLSDRERLLEIGENVVKPKPGVHRAAPLQELMDYLRPIIESRLASPGDDVISQLVTQAVDGRPLTGDEMMKLTISVLLGGLETTTSALGFITRFLAGAPAARRQLIENPSLIPAAVEELLRRYPPTLSGRVLTEDFEFRGASMRKGDHAMWTLGMFNLDERQFPDAMRVDFGRKKTPHLTFGAGIHFCVGAFLARAELRIFLERWLSVIPDFTVRSDVPVQYRTGLTMSLENLPLQIRAA
jgi:camphor 5-monooxygenase